MMMIFTGCSADTLTVNENQSTEEPEIAQNQEENNTESIMEENTGEETSEEKPESEERKVYKGRTYIFYKAVTLKMGVKNGIAYYDTIFPERTFDEYE